MDINECKVCQSYNLKKENNIIYCGTCGSYFVSNNKKVNGNIKNFSNKVAHFKNIIKSFNNFNNLDINQTFIDELKENISKQGISTEYIDTQFITEYSKKSTVRNKKNYILYYFILCNIKNENPFLNNDILNRINIIFYDFTNFLCRYNKINLTISYQLLINNILNIFDITNNLNPIIKNNIKDKKYDLWNKYIIDVCLRMLYVQSSNTSTIIYNYNYKQILCPNKIEMRLL